MERTGLDPALVEDVTRGCANQAGEDNRNVARMALLLAGLLGRASAGWDRQPAVRVRGSRRSTRRRTPSKADDGEVYIAGGVESMTRAPYVMAKAEGSAWQRGSRELHDSTLGWRFLNPRQAARHKPYSMGETAENTAGTLARHAPEAG